MSKKTEKPADAVEAVAALPPWRTVAIARRASRVYLDGGLTHVLGGELIAEPSRVATVTGDPNFELVDVASPDALAALEADRAARMSALRAEATALGCVVYRDGEVTPPRRPQ